MLIYVRREVAASVLLVGFADGSDRWTRPALLPSIHCCCCRNSYFFKIINANECTPGRLTPPCCTRLLYIVGIISDLFIYYEISETCKNSRQTERGTGRPGRLSGLAEGDGADRVGGYFVRRQVGIPSGIAEIIC